MLNYQNINKFTLSGLSATLIGNGIGRFAYIALMPALIQSGWFSAQDASYLGAATLLGYIFGAPLASVFSTKLSTATLIRISMLVSSISYLGCSFQESPLLLFYIYRFLAGLTGAILMVIAPPIIIRLHSAKQKSQVSGVIFSGIGIGAMLSGTLVPLLVYFSIQTAWIGMAIIAFFATIFSWKYWRLAENEIKQDIHFKKTPPNFLKQLNLNAKITVCLILIAYTLNAIGYLPHTLFWVDYIVRELDYSLFHAGLFWATFGIGAAIGPLITGYLGDRVGVKKSLILAFLLKAIAVALPLIGSNPMILFISSLVVGLFTPGTVTLVSTYTLEAVGYQLHTKAWGLMTLFFAISQGVVGYLMAAYSAHSTSYQQLFLISSLVLVISVTCIFLSSTKNLPK